jgi:hypothetical protein
MDRRTDKAGFFALSFGTSPPGHCPEPRGQPGTGPGSLDGAAIHHQVGGMIEPAGTWPCRSTRMPK